MELNVTEIRTDQPYELIQWSEVVAVDIRNIAKYRNSQKIVGRNLLCRTWVIVRTRIIARRSERSRWGVLRTCYI